MSSVAASHETIERGTVLADKYEVIAPIGEGGMGTVFEAENQLTGRRVALKWLVEGLRDDPRFRARLLREARAAAAIDSPHVVSVLDVAHHEGVPLLIMELLRGESAAAWLARERPTVEGLLECLGPSFLGVAAGHAAGIIHRDLKPANLFLVRDSAGAFVTSKVLDLGIAKAVDGEQMSITRSGSVVGTPAYMSPEQLRGARDLDARSDVYSLAVICYEALSGKRPYAATTVAELAVLMATTRPPPVAELRGEIARAASEAIERGLAYAREDRPATVEAFVAGLRGEPIEAPVDRLDTLPPLVTAETFEAALPASDGGAAREPTRSGTRTVVDGRASAARAAPPKRSRTLPLVAAALVVAGLAIAAAIYLSRAPASTATPEPRPQAALASPVDPPSPIAADPPPTVEDVSEAPPPMEPAPARPSPALPVAEPEPPRGRPRRARGRRQEPPPPPPELAVPLRTGGVQADEF